jgi:hypothetical protein
MTEVTVVRRWTPVVLAAALAAALAGLAGGPAYASAGSRPVLSVGGEVTTAASYTAAQLAALPQTTATVTASLLNTKNELLRVTVTVRGAGHRQVTFAVGELDAGFGPAGPAARRDPARLVPGTERNAGPHRGRPVPAHGAGRRADLADAQHLGRGRGPRQYVATVTPAEQLVGGRPLQLSLNEDGVALAQPRLVTDGDVHGGRYVSGVVDLYVGTGPAH